MLTIPPTFRARLDAEFQGRIRVRWSYQRNCFVVEQQESAAIHPGELFTHSNDDIAIRARDGYGLLFELWTGSTAACLCGADIPLTPSTIKVYECPTCQVRHGRTRQLPIASFDFTEGLLEALCRLDYIAHNTESPKDAVRRAWHANLRKKAAKDKAIAADRQLRLRDDWHRLYNVPRTGYRQDTPYWASSERTAP